MLAPASMMTYSSPPLDWWVGGACGVQEQPEEFHESLRQIPMRWRSSLSSIMTSMASNGGGFDVDSTGPDGTRRLVNTDMNGDGKGGANAGQGKVRCSGPRSR